MGVMNVIVGPPCAGKSTYARAHAEPGEVVVDYDALAMALGAETSHGTSGDVRSAAFEARDAVIEFLLTRGTTGDSWVIHTSPSSEKVDRYESAGARFVLLDPGQDECLARAEAEERPSQVVDAIHDWYANPPKLPDAQRNSEADDVWLYA